MCTSRIKDKIMDGLLKNGFTAELLQKMFIGFCGEGSSGMLGTKSRVGEQLEDHGSDMIMRRSFNHKLKLAVGNALDVTNLTDDLKPFLESLYSLCS